MNVSQNAVLKKNPTYYEISLALLNNYTSALYFSDLSQEQLKLAEFSRVNLDDADYQDEIRYNSFIHGLDSGLIQMTTL